VENATFEIYSLLTVRSLLLFSIARVHVFVVVL